MNPERVGRDGYLRLQFERRGASTVLARSRFTLPLQVLTPLETEDGSAYLMLLNPTGGVLGGDRLVTEIIQEPTTHACLTTPSATRIYRTSGQPADLQTTIDLKEGASLEYLPDHVIPHAGSALRQSLRLDMARGSRAVVLDAFASGRVAHGERWCFNEIDSRMEVFVCGQPVFLNRTRIDPVARPPRQNGVMGEYDYMICVGLFAEKFGDWRPVVAAVNAGLESMPQIYGGASPLSQHGCVVRYFAKSAAEMTRMNKKIWDIGRELLLNLPPLDHRKY